jgi:hypothetical protein
MKNSKRKLKYRPTSEISTQFIRYKNRSYRVTAWGLGENYSITDLSNAGKSGKFCNQATIEIVSSKGKIKSAWSLLRHKWQEIFDMISSYQPNDLAEYKLNNDFRLYIGRSNAIEIMPFDLSIIPPLKCEPKKWNMSHVIRALVNGQYKSLVQNYFLSNYGEVQRFKRMKILDVIDLATDLVETPIKRRPYQEEGKVYVPLGFDSIEFIPLIKTAQHKSQIKKRS